MPPASFALRNPDSLQLEPRELLSVASAIAQITAEQSLTQAQIDGILAGTIIPATFEQELAAYQAQKLVLEAQITQAAPPADGLTERTWGDSLNVNPGVASYPPAVSPDGALFIVPSGTTGFDVRDTRTGAVVRRLSGHTDSVAAAAFSPDSSRIATVSYDKTLRIWNTASGALQRTVTLAHFGLSVDWTDGSTVVVGVHERTGLRVNADSGATAVLQTSGPADVAGTHAVSGFDRTVYDVDVTTGTRRTLGGVSTYLYSRAASDTHHAAGTQGGEIAVWALASGARTTLRSSGPTVWNLTFSRDGKDLFASLQDGQILRFTLGQNGAWTQETAATFGGDVYGATLGSDGKTLIAVNGGPSATLRAVTLARPTAGIPESPVVTALRTQLTQVNGFITAADHRVDAAELLLAEQDIEEEAAEALQTLLTDGTPEDFAARAVLIRARLEALHVPVTPETKTPTMRVTAREAVEGNLRIDVTNIQPGWKAVFGGVQVVLPADGMVELPLASFTHADRRVYTVQLLRADGSVADDDVGGFGVAAGKHTYRGYGYDPSSYEVMTSLTYDVSVPLAPALQDEVDALREELAAIEAQQALFAAEDARLEQLDAQLVRDRREAAVAIPILQQLITSLNGQIPTLLQAKLQAEAAYDATVGRWNVTGDEINAARYAKDRAHEAWDIATQRLSHAQAALSGGIAAFQNMSPERAAVPELSIVGVNGNQLVLEVAHTHAGANVEAVRDNRAPGYANPVWQVVTTQPVRTLAAGEHSSFVSVAFNTGMPTGTYYVRLIDAAAVVNQETFEVQWNASTQTITLAGDSFFPLAQIPAVDGLAAPLAADVTSVRDEAARQAAALAPTYAFWEASYAGTMRMVPEVVWSKLGITVNIPMLQREIAHRASPSHVAATEDGDATLRQQALAGGIAGDSFDYRRNWVMGDAYWTAQETAERLAAGAAAYFSHLLRLRSGTASTFDARCLDSPFTHPGTGAAIMQAVQTHFADCYAGLMHVKSEQEAMLAAQENGSEAAGNAERSKAAQQRRVISSIQAILASPAGIGSQDQRIANVLAAYPDAARLLQAQIDGGQTITYRGQPVSEEVMVALGEGRALLAEANADRDTQGQLDLLAINEAINLGILDENGQPIEGVFDIGGQVLSAQALIAIRDLGGPLESARERLGRSSDQQVFTEVHAWSSSTSFAPGNLDQLQAKGVAGKIFVGIAKYLWGASDFGEQIQIAVMAERVTGINALQLMKLPRTNHDRFANGLMNLMRLHGFAFLDPSLNSNSASPMQASLSQSSPNAMRIHVGFGSANYEGLTPLNVGIYLVDAETNEQYGILRENIQWKLYATIDMSTLQLPFESLRDRDLQLKVVQFYNEIDQNEQHCRAEALTDSFSLSNIPYYAGNAALPRTALDWSDVKYNPDYYTKDGQYHVGVDISRRLSTNEKFGEGSEVVWQGPSATVIDWGYSKRGNTSDYGTMWVLLDVHLPMPVTVATEISEVPGATSTGLAQTVTTDHIRVYFGHIRPSPNFIENESAERRFKDGLSFLNYKKGDQIRDGMILGYIERHGYEGNSSGEHVHVGAYDADQMNDSVHIPGVDWPFSEDRAKFIDPQSLLPILFGSN